MQDHELPVLSREHLAPRGPVQAVVRFQRRRVFCTPFSAPGGNRRPVVLTRRGRGVPGGRYDHQTTESGSGQQDPFAFTASRRVVTGAAVVGHGGKNSSTVTTPVQVVINSLPS